MAPRTRESYRSESAWYFESSVASRHPYLDAIVMQPYGWTMGDAVQVELSISTWQDLFDADDVNQLRDEQRRVASANGCSLVLTDVTTTDRGVRLLEVVTKGRRGLGHDYVGITCGTSGSNTFTVRITAIEPGVTGLREAVVSAHLLELGELELPTTAMSEGSHAIPGWSEDPYSPAWDDEVSAFFCCRKLRGHQRLHCTPRELSLAYEPHEERRRPRRRAQRADCLTQASPWLPLPRSGPADDGGADEQCGHHRVLM